MKRLIFTFALIVATSLGGCSSTTDTSDDTLSFGQWVVREVVTNVVDLATEDSCERREGKSLQSVASCKKQVKMIERIGDEEERKQALQRAEALQRDFDKRANTTDTAEMIEKLRRKNDWIGNSQNEQSVIVIKKDEFE